MRIASTLKAARGGVIVLGWLLALGAASAQTTVPVAGVKPEQRPVGAPELKEVQRPGNWRDRTLKGISKPYPTTLKFIDSHGAWYTPFDHRGMPGRYDIRKLHGN